MQETLVLPVLLLLGVLSGALTTLAGLGGGILLLLALSLFLGPTAALATTAPALLAGNLHRLWMFRRSLDRRVSLSFVAGALPGSVAGGFLAARVPEAVLAWLMVGMTALAVTRAMGLWKWQPRASVLLPAGAGIGVLTGTSGGAGVLAAPVLLASGLTGQAYIATAALCSVAMHTGRVVAYGAGGLVTRETLIRASALAIALIVGNLAGKRLRQALRDEKRSQRIEIGTLVVCVGLSLLGLGR